MVGIDENQNEFKETKKEGGSKYLQSHTHAMASSGTHSHGVNFDQVWSWGGTTSIATTSGGPYGGSGYIHNSGEHTHTINNSGSGNSENLQPYITVYIWERIS